MVWKNLKIGIENLKFAKKPLLTPTAPVNTRGPLRDQKGPRPMPTLFGDQGSLRQGGVFEFPFSLAFRIQSSFQALHGSPKNRLGLAPICFKNNWPRLVLKTLALTFCEKRY